MDLTTAVYEQRFLLPPNEIASQLRELVNKAYYAVQTDASQVADGTGWYNDFFRSGRETHLRVISWPQQASNHGYLLRPDSLSLKLMGDKGTDWEVFAVATSNDDGGRFKSKGLVSICLAALETSLAERQIRDASIPKLWVRIVQHINGTYWRARGFREVERAEIPAGTWGYDGPDEKGWIIETLVSEVSATQTEVTGSSRRMEDTTS